MGSGDGAGLLHKKHLIIKIEILKRALILLHLPSHTNYQMIKNQFNSFTFLIKSSQLHEVQISNFEHHVFNVIELFYEKTS